MPRAWLASFLLAIGRRARARHLVLLDAALGHIALGRWLAQCGAGRVRRVKTREDLFEVALPSLEGRRPLYIELGVHRGDSIRWWAAHLKAPDASLVGFDSFTGLPERWNEQNPAGRFSTDGNVPAVDDPRVGFVRGWFEETLATYDAPDHDAVLLNFDADLYSSTLTALRGLRHLMTPGAWLYLDELNDKNHELRALEEFLNETKIDVSPIARAANGRHWLFRVDHP